VLLLLSYFNSFISGLYSAPIRNKARQFNYCKSNNIEQEVADKVLDNGKIEADKILDNGKIEATYNPI